MQTFPSHQVRSRYSVYSSSIWFQSWAICPSIPFFSDKILCISSCNFKRLYLIQNMKLWTTENEAADITITFLLPLIKQAIWLIQNGLNDMPYSKFELKDNKLAKVRQQGARSIIIIKMGQQQAYLSRREEYTQKFGKVELIIPGNAGKEVKMAVKIDVDTDSSPYKHWKTQMQWIKHQQDIADLILLPLHLNPLTCLACSASNKPATLEVSYPKVNHSLSEVIRHRKSIGRHFSESELWYLLYALVKVAAFLQGHNQSIGNVHPLNVMINQNSRIQLFTTFSSPTELTNLAKIKISHHHDAYLAPEQSRLINQDSSLSQNSIDQNKADTFHIGLVLLSAILLKDCYHLYSRSLFELNHERLFYCQAQMRKMSQRLLYRQKLINLVDQFLRIDPSKRKTPQFYLQRLKRYEKMILQLEDFYYELETAEDTAFSILQPQQSRQAQTKKEKKYLSLLKTKPKKEIKLQEQEGHAKQQTDLISTRLFK